jgi:branched-chain amino acid transport system substrate-binding protein
MKKIKLIYSLILILCLLFSGCTTKVQEEVKSVPGVSDTEVLIGSSSALGGHASFLGTQNLHGSLAYLKEINENGGVHGRQIKIISYDDSYDPPKTVANTQKLISQDGVFALFDYVGTPTSVKIIDVVHQAKTPILGLFTGAESLRTPFRPYIFNVRDSYYNEAEGAITYFVDKLGFSKIACFYQNDAFGKAVLSGAQLALERRNMELIATDTFERGTMDVEGAMENIKNSGAEAIIMVGTYSPLAKFVKVSNDVGYKPYFHTVSFVGSEAYGKELVEVQKIDPSQYEKIIVTQVVPSPFSEEFETVREYKELAKKHYPQDEPNYVALEGFVNAKVLVAALKGAGKELTRETFIDSLEAMQNVPMGIGKSITYTTTDHQGLQGIYYSKVTNDGTFRIFNP